MSSLHEPNAAIAALKIIILVLLLGAIAGLGYWYLRGLEPAAPVEEANSWPLINETLDVQFSVPDGWSIVERREEGVSGEELTFDETGEPLFDCETHVELLANGKVFLVADDNGDCDPPGRGGFWGDQADRVTSLSTLLDWCKDISPEDACTFQTNAYGVTYVHVHYEQLESWGEMLNDVDEYFLFHEGHDWDGIILSDEAFVRAGFTGDAELLQSIVDSIQFQL